MGERDQGQDVRTNNGNYFKYIWWIFLILKKIVTAVMAIANIVKTSLGP